MDSVEQRGVLEELSSSEHALLGERSGVGHGNGGGDRGRGVRGGRGQGGSSLGRVGASEGGPGEEGGESSEDTVFLKLPWSSEESRAALFGQPRPSIPCPWHHCGAPNLQKDNGHSAVCQVYESGRE